MKNLLLLAVLAVSVQVQAQPVTIDGLGTIDFPNSGAPEAQEAFHRGVLLLHSFEFGPARQAFQAAQEADPAFALAYWGEAMAQNYPLWRNRDLELGRETLKRLAPTTASRRNKAPTAREKMYLDAVEMLYGEGSKEEQDLAYLDAMRRLHEAFPQDDEARSFYALAILGSVNGERDFATYMRAAAVAYPVFLGNPNHPGAAHYLIHSFDDPVHAPLGLSAAEAYAAIAPDAAHAQHMTTHIFLELGMWDQVVEANIRAMNVQDASRAARGQGPNTCGHYSSWRHYGHLMLGEWSEAETLMDACHADIQSGASRSWFYFAGMRARHVMDSQDWSLAERWRVDVPVFGEPENTASINGGPDFTYALTNAMAGVMANDFEAAEAMLAGDWGSHPGRLIQLDQLRGLLLVRRGQRDEGLRLLADAAHAADQLPFAFGPPEIVKPAHELYAQVLAETGDDATEAYREAVSRTPGRPLSQQSAASQQ
ncbi:MAG: hypothetical protein HKN29_09705 [Rhodothermales bacterium]|nr:hypothetical protein [Rhodothermales bacterium]